MDEELKETMALAMSVGATRIQILHETALTAVDQDRTVSAEPGSEAGGGDPACST